MDDLCLRRRCLPPVDMVNSPWILRRLHSIICNARWKPSHIKGAIVGQRVWILAYLQ